MTLQHVDDYPEIPISLDTTRSQLKTGGWRSVRPVLSERVAPCADGCPAGLGIASYLHHISAGRLDEAIARFSERNPFPRITGRVCPHTCEDACNLAIVTDDGPVSIRSIERWLGDATAHSPHVVPHADTGRSIAVVGSGPAGMAASYYLARSGHRVTLFERDDLPGGMLRHAIPSYRLPAAIVDDEFDRLRDMGVEIRTGVTLGADVTVEELLDEFDAVFAATGACRERPVGIEGEGLLERGLEYLRRVSRGEATVPEGSCAVIGGGNTAMDVARVLRRLGSDVTVLYRRTEAEMPAIREEYDLAVAEGVGFQWLTLPRAAAESEHGIALTVEAMRLGAPDDSGRPRSEPTGETMTLEFAAVFAAVGELADVSPFPERLIGAGGWLDMGPGGATADESVLAGGDLVTGPATVIEAIVAGREAARSIDRRLGLEDLWEPIEGHPVVASDETNQAYVTRTAGIADPHVYSTDPMDEETLTVGSCDVLDEIGRCMSCGHCNECGTCFVFCPDGAITWEDGPVVDLEFCKGCGICVVECPGRAMVLVNERDLEVAGV
jgi:NADPH-dependent glutamate synthase beta subunit-like oxidoreductase/Pyruvate/2-oxoacid:ferredoxin oxidoreductase delta subunit